MSSTGPNGTRLPLNRLSLCRSGARAEATLPPPPSALIDGERRQVRYLRLSVTDRCNFRCVYCMPADGVPFEPHEGILTFEEAARLVRAFAALGIRRVRLTGGEPLLRRDFVRLVELLAAVPGIEDLALSTNGFLFAPQAHALRAAGLRRVNISLDTLRPERFRALTRVGSLDRVLDAVDAAVDAGFAPVKLNAVIIRGNNDDELSELVRYAAERRALLRFIEYMPIGVDGFWSDDTFLSTDEMIHRLGRDWIVHPLRGFAADAGIVGGGPARYGLLEPRDGAGEPVEVGFISALSQNFCAACNRVRVTAVGDLQECLAYPGRLSLRDLMRGGADDGAIIHHIEQALFGKGAGHRFDPFGGGVRTHQAMSVTGG